MVLRWYLKLEMVTFLRNEQESFIAVAAKEEVLNKVNRLRMNKVFKRDSIRWLTKVSVRTRQARKRTAVEEPTARAWPVTKQRFVSRLTGITTSDRQARQNRHKDLLHPALVH